MLAMVVDMARRVVTAREMRAGAWGGGGFVMVVMEILDYSPEASLTDARPHSPRPGPTNRGQAPLTEARSIQKENQLTTTIMVQGR